jgi:hypothetical protein
LKIASERRSEENLAQGDGHVGIREADEKLSMQLMGRLERYQENKTESKQ